MRRRDLLGTGVAAVALPNAWAQLGPAPRRVGVLAIEGGQARLAAALAELGVVDGRDIVIVGRSALLRADEVIE
ncbi:MAG: hypothetical protein ABIR94_03765 [Rubrivivax sp.]